MLVGENNTMWPPINQKLTHIVFIMKMSRFRISHSSLPIPSMFLRDAPYFWTVWSLGQDCHRRAWSAVSDFMRSNLEFFSGRAIESESTVLPALTSWISDTLNEIAVPWFQFPLSCGMLFSTHWSIHLRCSVQYSMMPKNNIAYVCLHVPTYDEIWFNYCVVQLFMFVCFCSAWFACSNEWVSDWINAST